MKDCSFCGGMEEYWMNVSPIDIHPVYEIKPCENCVNHSLGYVSRKSDDDILAMRARAIEESLRTISRMKH